MSKKKLALAIAGVVCSFSLIGNTQANALETAGVKQAKREEPKVATVKKLVNGDLLCYVDIVDEKGKKHHWGADFSICANEKTYLNKKVNLTYKVANVSDCQSAEPCGKTRRETIISKMQVVKNTSKKPIRQDVTTISNGKWTITVGGGNSWSGVNGTGNFSYRGCDAKGQCINLTGGKATCRNGVCYIGWTNKEYSYILESPITEGGSISSGSVLTVRKGNKVILRETGFKIRK